MKAPDQTIRGKIRCFFIQIVFEDY